MNMVISHSYVSLPEGTLNIAMGRERERENTVPETEPLYTRIFRKNVLKMLSPT